MMREIAWWNRFVRGLVYSTSGCCDWEEITTDESGLLTTTILISRVSWLYQYLSDVNVDSQTLVGVSQLRDTSVQSTHLLYWMIRPMIYLPRNLNLSMTWVAIWLHDSSLNIYHTI